MNILLFNFKKKRKFITNIFKIAICVILFVSILFLIFILKVKNLKSERLINVNNVFVIQALCKNNVFLTQDIESELVDNIENQLNDIDFSKLENITENLNDNEKNIFGSNSFLKLVKSFIYGENINQHENFFSYLISIIFKETISLLPYFAIIVFISILYSLLGQFSNNKVSIKNIVYIVCFASIALIVIKVIISLLSTSKAVIDSISTQMEAIFPILLTLITALGGTTTVGTFQPILAVLTTFITKIFTIVLIPILIFSVVFNIVGNISNNVKLDKFSKFFSSLFNWIVGIVFTIFISFLTVRGLTASSIDGISIKTAKFALKSHIPILGSYLSEGIGLILTSSSLIKNSVGVTGLVLLFSTLITPIITLITTILLFKLVAALIQPLCDEKISNFIYSISKSLNLLIVSLIAIGFMYLISISILMMVSNIF